MRDAPFKWFFSILALALAVSAAGAQSTNATGLTQPLPDVGTSLLRLGGAMVLVLAVFFGGVWCFRNWQRLLAGRRPSSKLQILEVKALGNRQALYLVTVEGQKLLLGSSPAGLTSLCNLPAPESEMSTTIGKSFDENLQTMLSGAS